MSDLVAELREYAKNWRGETVIPLIAQAADEVERLRAILEWLDSRGGLGLDVHEYIRKALDGPADETPRCTCVVGKLNWCAVHNAEPEHCPKCGERTDTYPVGSYHKCEAP